MSHRHKVDRWLMVLTTKEASYIIVLGIVISVLPISSTHTANCQAQPWKSDRPMSSLTPIVWIALFHKVGWIKTLRCKRHYSETNHWKSIMWIWMLPCNYWVDNECFDLSDVSVNRLSTFLSLTHFTMRRLHCRILSKWWYWSALYAIWQMPCLLPQFKNQYPRNLNGFSKSVSLDHGSSRELSGDIHFPSIYWLPF
jgi:hypothetical protein